MVCKITNELCHSGECRCGYSESCAEKPWSPTCDYDLISGSFIWYCTCGNSGSGCDQYTEICDEEESSCIQSKSILRRDFDNLFPIFEKFLRLTTLIESFLL